MEMIDFSTKKKGAQFEWIFNTQAIIIVCDIQSRPLKVNPILMDTQESPIKKVSDNSLKVTFRVHADLFSDHRKWCPSF